MRDEPPVQAEAERPLHVGDRRVHLVLHRRPWIDAVQRRPEGAGPVVDLVEPGRVAGLGVVLEQVAQQPVDLQAARHGLEAEVAEVPAVVHLKVQARGPDRGLVGVLDGGHVLLAGAGNAIDQRAGLRRGIAAAVAGGLHLVDGLQLDAAVDLDVEPVDRPVHVADPRVGAPGRAQHHAGGPGMGLFRLQLLVPDLVLEAERSRSRSRLGRTAAAVVVVRPRRAHQGPADVVSALGAGQTTRVGDPVGVAR